jgi:cob(I)alamin adenosyltransferase
MDVEWKMILMEDYRAVDAAGAAINAAEKAEAATHAAWHQGNADILNGQSALHDLTTMLANEKKKHCLSKKDKARFARRIAAANAMIARGSQEELTADHNLTAAQSSLQMALADLNLSNQKLLRDEWLAAATDITTGQPFPPAPWH